jgi:abortive infection alpha-like protein
MASAGDESRPAGDEGLVESLPGLARVYASAWWHAAEWTVSSSLDAASRLARSAAGGEPPSELLAGAATELRDYARRVLGGGDRVDSADAEPPPTLRARGEELLRRSADVDDDEPAHPAYERILCDLAPDEARILRLLMLEGPQPSVDVRAGLPLASSLVAPGRNMIGAEAGCRHLDRVPAHLNNLYRLGLIWFSREPVSDGLRYQVLEAQPEVLEGLRKGGRTARTVRRCILLTPFGRDFCEVCLPVETAELDALEDERTDEPGAAAGDGA